MSGGQTDDAPVQYQATREVRTYAELYHAANVLRYKAQNDASGSHYVIMSAILMVAFTFEAFLNHLGDKILTDWSTHDRKNMNEKLDTLAQKVNCRIDRSRRPAQTIKMLFRFRDRIAHGRTEILTLNEVVSDDYKPEFRAPATETETWCNVENLERAMNDTRDFISTLHSAEGLPGEAFTQGLSTFSLKPIENV